MFRSSNPALKNDAFQPAQTWDDFNAKPELGGELMGGAVAATASAKTRSVPKARGGASHMTVQGTVQKTAFLLLILIGCSALTWQMVSDGTLPMWPTMLIGAFGGLGIALVIGFVPKSAPVLAPVYAVVKGGLVGSFSLVVADQAGQRMGENAPDLAIVFNAALITFGIAGGVLMAYTTKLIRPNRTFYNVTIAATIGVCLYGLIAFAASMIFDSYSMASVYDINNGGMISIGFSLFVIVLAAANLVLDFDIVAQGAANRAPKYMEWYGGFAIMVSLVWLYIEVLRLLSKLQSRD